MRSMTGFASLDGGAPSATETEPGGPPPRRWSWVARSVNNRGLEIRVRAPSGWEAREPAWRALVSERFRRGSVTLALSMDGPAAAGRGIRINEAVLEQLMGAALKASERLGALGGAASLSVDGLLALRGVIEAEAPEEGAPIDETFAAAVDAGLAAVLDGLARSRAEEGAHLSETLSGQIERISSLTEAAQARAEARSGDQKQRLRERVAGLLEAAEQDLDTDRLAQELALLAVKSDVREELDRLRAHIAAARALIASTEPVGRKFDFLTQEFNREANTLCAKAQDAALTEIGLELKVAIDQLREQAANVE